jgi:hypothetical protein
MAKKKTTAATPEEVAAAQATEEQTHATEAETTAQKTAPAEVPAAEEVKSEETVETKPAEEAPKKEETVVLDNKTTMKEATPTKAAPKKSSLVDKVSHTRQYYQLKTMLETYTAMCSKPSNDKNVLTSRMKQSYAIVQFVLRYPYQECCDLLFDTLVSGRGTVFKPGTLCVMANDLPFAERNKFTSFYNAFCILVDHKVYKTRIVMDMEAVRATIGNDRIVTALSNIRKRIEG